MSAIDDSNGAREDPIQVLISMHQGMDTLDFAGPLEVLSHARHNIKDPSRSPDWYRSCAEVVADPRDLQRRKPSSAPLCPAPNTP